MIETYTGEWLASPNPLEMGLHFCSHKCLYCFANLQLPTRQADVPAIMRFLSYFESRSTLTAQLLKAGYAVVISNRVDPFALSNFKAALPIMETMSALNIDVSFQTKGGKGIDRAIELFPHSVWYISISFWDDAKRERIEPGAPSLQSRYDLIEKLVGLNHPVVIGMNPLVREWLPSRDRDALLAHLKALGAHGVWTEPLHLNRKQLANIKDNEIEAMGYSVVKRALTHHPPDVLDYYHESRRAIRDAGLEVFSVGQFEPSEFFAPWREVYAHTFPIQQDFVNWCHANKKAGDLVTFDEWWDVLGGEFPTGIFPNMYQYFNQSRQKFQAGIPKDMSYRDALTIIWQEPRARRSPQDILCFAIATRNGEVITDAAGLPVLAFNPEGQFEPTMEVT